jgi:DNA-binding protein YbaB
MNFDASSPSVDSEKTKKPSRSKSKSVIRILPLLIAALFFGYRQVVKELERKDQQHLEYATKAATREAVRKMESQRRMKDLVPDLPKDIVASFAEPRDDEAFNRMLFAAFENPAVYIGAANNVLKSGGHKTALQAALLYCREIDASKKKNKVENSSIGACLKKFGFQTSVTGDHLTISASGEQSEKASPRPAQED